MNKKESTAIENETTPSDQEIEFQKTLSQDKRNLVALLGMAEIKADQGDDRAANAFYKAALNMVNAGTSFADNLRPKLQQAQEFLASAQGRFESYLLQQLDQAGVSGKETPLPIRQALDLLMGRREICYQNPSMFYYPGMPQREFYERHEFPWLAEIEAAIPDMRNELQGVIADTNKFNPYVESDPSRPQPNNPLLDSSDWGAYYFWRSGEPQSDHLAKCPRTVAALERAPIPQIKERSPMALYSVLEPGTHIAPHFGLLNTRLICHIPLMLPSDCALRVGSETRPWKDGEALIFDDSFEHEAWNRSKERRVILLFEIWRPEISEQEQAALTTIFESINHYQKPVEI
ncbi:MAG: aspartyl/asparaginyl beta-hydroxylase domain-containing protein [Parasphingorhabdus sp.]